MPTQPDLPEFWEAAFAARQEMWGREPAQAAVLARELFARHAARQVLIPGIGYGRNAQVFLDAGMGVTGIEISRTAIDLAYQHYGPGLPIYHGSVTDMPFDDRRYDGIFCHALIHLLDHAERGKLIGDCFRQLTDGGHLVFSAIAKTASTYGQGQCIGPDRYAQFGGVNMFFYDAATIQAEFGAAGLLEVQPVQDTYPLHLIICRKAAPDPTSQVAG